MPPAAERLARLLDRCARRATTAASLSGPSGSPRLAHAIAFGSLVGVLCTVVTMSAVEGSGIAPRDALAATGIALVGIALVGRRC